MLQVLLRETAAIGNGAFADGRKTRLPAAFRSRQIGSRPGEPPSDEEIGESSMRCLRRAMSYGSGTPA